jgi:FkbH-like protein
MDTVALPWLPEAPPTFSSDVRTLRRSGAVAFAELKRLATARLNVGQLSVLSRACQSLVDRGTTPLLRLRVLSNATMDLVVPALIATAPRHGFLLGACTGAFGSWASEALDQNSQTRSQSFDAVLLALDRYAFDLAPCPGDAALAERRVRAALEEVLTAAAAVQQRAGCVVLLQTLVETGGALFGSMDAQIPGTTRWMLGSFNRKLRERRLPGQLLLDVAQLAAQVGVDRWHDAALWNLGKFPVSAAATPLYADHVCRLLMALRGLSKKCLVLDLDNTIWGGVIGDDGITGIVVGQGSAAGEAHLAVQAAALALRERGVVLAVSSKNDDLLARQPFRELPEMLLREEHFAVFQANWQDKASNLRAIAKALNIGVDALVLLDDNPSERLQVRNALPEVAVPELPDSPEHYAALLLAAGYFESVQFTEDDRQRAQQYGAMAARNAELGAAGDLQSHLASLQMTAEIRSFDANGRPRIAQLINKTNQFNLTTRRRNEAEVEALEQGGAPLTMQVRLKDRFGDNGMVCVLVCVAEGEAWLIDTWLMSCRVLNRRLEHAVLNAVVQAASRHGVQRLVGLYLPTAKNALVSDHYASLGFSPEVEQEGQDHSVSSRWVLDLKFYQSLASPIEVLDHLDTQPA